MSTNFGIVGYLDVPRSEAETVLAQCQSMLQGAGWIEGDEDPEAAYAPRGPCFRPGPTSGIETKAYTRVDGSVSKPVNGVVFAGPRYINSGPITSVPSFVCPACGTRTTGAHALSGEPESDLARPQLDRCFDLIGRYYESDDPSRVVACVVCDAHVDVNDLIDDGPPTFVLSEVAVEFWQWPPDTVDAVASVLDAGLARAHRQGWVKV
jgi:hypothetical protein